MHSRLSPNDGNAEIIHMSFAMEPTTTGGRARECNEDEIQNWRKKVWPAIKKKALREERILVFIDESGLSQRPHRCRTWAPRGQTPILQYNFNWKSLSVAAGLTVWNFYFRLYAGAVKKEQVLEFSPSADSTPTPEPSIASAGSFTPPASDAGHRSISV